jgi:peptidoglycan-associated lipoprotein
MRDTIMSLRTITFVAATLAMSLIAACGPDYPNCDTDTDCHAGEFCVNNLCQQCRTNEDCGAGKQCVSGECQATPGYCASNADCAEGETCENNVCVSGPVTQSQPPVAPTPGGCQLDAVYFGFDSATLDDAARNQLSGVASCLQQKGLKSVHLTGLTDPRGTEEYNMALGDRRAQAAKTYLKSLGVASELSSSSMGEELASGADEGGWSRDRRVDVRER